MIGSNIKALTTLLLAELVDQGKMRWDQPVIDLYPDFRFSSPEFTKRVLVQHLVCACTGLPRRNLEWTLNDRMPTPSSLFHLLETSRPTTTFGEAFQYSNLLAAAAGYVAAYEDNPEGDLRTTYAELMKTKVCDPLEMRSTTFITTLPGKDRIEFTPTEHTGQRGLLTRDAQHECHYAGGE